MKSAVLFALLAVSSSAFAVDLPLTQDIADQLGNENGNSVSVTFLKDGVSVYAGGEPPLWYTEVNMTELAAKLQKNNKRVQKVGDYTILTNWGLIEINGKTVVDHSTAYLQTEEERQANLKDPEAFNSEMDYEFSATSTLISLVGPVASTVLSMSYFSGGAHPSGYTGLETKSLETGKQVRLQDIATPASIVKALQTDKYIQRIVGPKTRAALKRAKSLKEVYSILSNALLIGRDGTEDCPGLFFVDEPSEENKTATGTDRNFGILEYNAAKNRFSVRLVLEPASEACRGIVKQLGLELEPQPSFVPALKKAKAGNGLFIDKKKLSDLLHL